MVLNCHAKVAFFHTSDHYSNATFSIILTGKHLKNKVPIQFDYQANAKVSAIVHYFYFDCLTR